ncbi:MAG: ABC transporter ATP-binding protein, partial [candidate division WOR-3 bacterium]
MEAKYLIRLTGITFGYNGKPLLFDSLDFFLPENCRIGIIGPNGCGKTTLLNIIMGFVKPISGVIEIFGAEMKGEKDFQKARRLIGFLFQNSDDQLFCPSVKEEVAFGPLNYRLPKEEVERRVKKSLELVGLEKFEAMAPYRLSEGEKKKLAIATILAMQPKILLLDEPTNGLDEEGVKRVINILNSKKFTYAIISQDINFLKQTTEKIYTIENGRLVE